MSFLLDTNVVSETRRKRPDAKVMAWLHRTDPMAVYVSALTLGEIAKGVYGLLPRDPARAAGLQRWLEALRLHYSDRVIGIDAEIAEEWGRLAAARPLPVIDGLLAATASVRSMTLVTRDADATAAAGVSIFNPWKA